MLLKIFIAMFVVLGAVGFSVGFWFLISAFVERSVRPILINTWAWCYKRNLPFPNLWEGFGGLAFQMLITTVLWFGFQLYFIYLIAMRWSAAIGTFFS